MGTPRKKIIKNAKQRAAPVSKEKFHCICCGDEYDSEVFYNSNSIQFKALGKIPYCPICLEEIYTNYKNEFIKMGYKFPEKKAVQRFCMAFDLYYTDKMYDSTVKCYLQSQQKSKNELRFIMFYFQQLKLVQYKNKNYTSTINNQYKDYKDSIGFNIFENNEEDDKTVKDEKINKATKFFGDGFNDTDYIFLQDQYDDWTTRHECQTKSQEEMFKQICFTQLNIWKSERAGHDTKDLQATFLKQLEAAKLQPKQNKSETLSEAQTFGTLIDKWENTRPIPEVDPELQDVDSIGLLIDVFFRGHLAKFMNLKNGLSKLYDKYIKRYTVEKVEDTEEEDTEAIFDTIFGNQIDSDE